MKVGGRVKHKPRRKSLNCDADLNYRVFFVNTVGHLNLAVICAHRIFFYWINTTLPLGSLTLIAMQYFNQIPLNTHADVSNYQH